MLEQTGQSTMVFIHENSKKGKKTENTLQVWTNCIFFGEKIYSLFEIVNVPVHCDFRPQTSVDTGDLSSRDHSITQCCLRFDSLNKVCTHTLHLERKRLNI